MKAREWFRFAIPILGLVLGGFAAPYIADGLLMAMPIVDPVVTPIVVGICYAGLAGWYFYQMYRSGRAAKEHIGKAHEARKAAKEKAGTNKGSAMPNAARRKE